MAKPTLNLGCGATDWGDVRIDIDFHTQVGLSSKLNLRGDAHNLPFIDKAFSSVRCWHVLEHLKAPERAIQEMRRVSETGNVRFPIDDGFKREILRNLVSLSARGIYYAYLTRKKRFHLWIIKPLDPCAQKNSFELFPFLRTGRKGRFFRRVPFPRIPIEWEIPFDSGNAVTNSRQNEIEPARHAI